MTAAAFADLVQARSLGRGRWQARCPAHPDRSPSLAIKAGREGRVLVRCWAGCELRDVLAALELSTRDLFTDAPRNASAIRWVRKERSEREAEEQATAKVERRAGDLYRRLTRVVDLLGARLTRAPDGPEGDALALVFHRACLMLARAETALGCHGGSVKSPPGLPGRLFSPFTDPDPEALEAAVVMCEAQLFRYIGTGVAGPQTAQSPAASGALKEVA